MQSFIFLSYQKKPINLPNSVGEEEMDGAEKVSLLRSRKRGERTEDRNKKGDILRGRKKKKEKEKEGMAYPPIWKLS